MALINCPECKREISDTIDQCPFCGYVFKKENKRKKFLIAMVAIAVCIVVIILGTVFVIRDNQNLKKAENLISRGKYSEADVVLTEVHNSKKKNALITQIVLYEAKKALEEGNYVLAEKKISMIPAETIDAELLYEINTQKAEAILGQGRYLEADELYSELEQTEEIKNLREQLFFESRILYCASMIQETLLYPESMVIEELILKHSEAKDEELSTEEQTVYISKNPIILFHYSAKSRGGSMVDSFVRFMWEDNDYAMGVDVDTLEYDEEEPWDYEYMDAEEKHEYHRQQLEIAEIRLMLFWGDWFETYDMDRLNKVIQNGCADDVQMIDYNEIVAEPTPEIVMVSPSPAGTTKP